MPIAAEENQDSEEVLPQPPGGPKLELRAEVVQRS
jgi:hypothetical protein